MQLGRVSNIKVYCKQVFTDHVTHNKSYATEQSDTAFHLQSLRIIRRTHRDFIGLGIITLQKKTHWALFNFGRLS